MTVFKLPLIFFFLLLMLKNTSTALAAGPPSQIPEKFLPQNCTFFANFQQTQTLNDIPKPIVSSGNFYFDCHSGLIWQTLEPVAEIFVYTTDKKHYRLTKSGQLELIKGRIQKNIGKLLTSLMGGNSEFLERYFSIQSPKQSSSTLRLSPKKKRISKFISSLELSKTEEEVNIFWKNNLGNQTTLKITNEMPFKKFEISQCKSTINNEASCNVLAEQQ